MAVAMLVTAMSSISPPFRFKRSRFMPNGKPERSHHFLQYMIPLET
jgi:hypothetical protein